MASHMHTHLQLAPSDTVDEEDATQVPRDGDEHQDEVEFGGREDRLVVVAAEREPSVLRPSNTLSHTAAASTAREAREKRTSMMTEENRPLA